MSVCLCVHVSACVCSAATNVARCAGPLPLGASDSAHNIICLQHRVIVCGRRRAVLMREAAMVALGVLAPHLRSLTSSKKAKGSTSIGVADVQALRQRVDALLTSMLKNDLTVRFEQPHAHAHTQMGTDTHARTHKHTLYHTHAHVHMQTVIHRFVRSNQGGGESGCPALPGW